MYTIKGETDHRPRLDAWDKRSDLVLWEDLEGAGGEGAGAATGAGAAAGAAVEPTSSTLTTYVTPFTVIL